MDFCTEAQTMTTSPPRPPPPRVSAVQRDDETAESTAVFKTFQKLHDKAYASVQKGLDADEEGDLDAAENHYGASVALLDEILATDCENLTGATADERDTARQMQQKVNKTKLQISYRLESLQDNGVVVTGHADTSINSQACEEVKLPSYEEAVSSDHSSFIPGAALGDGAIPTDHSSMATERLASTEGAELFSIPDGVQIFRISHEGCVSTPSYPTSLHIIRLPEQGESNPEMQSDHTPPAYLQVGDWIYPLIPAASPVLHTLFGAYVFPDLSPDGSGSSVGLMLPETLGQEERHVLEDILRNFSAVQNQQCQTRQDDSDTSAAPVVEKEGDTNTVPKDVCGASGGEQKGDGVHEQSTADKISCGIVMASKWISWGVGKSAEKAGELISYGSTKLRATLQPEAQPRPVDPRVQKGMMYARKATNTAVSVSSFIVTKLGEATMSLGRQVAPHIRKKGGEIMPESMKTEQNKSRMDGVLQVAASGIKGLGTVYISLERGAKALGRSIAKETVTTVNYKYGEHAGKLTEDTMFSAGNVAMTAYNAESFGVKAVATRAAKDAGKAVVENVHEENDGNQADARFDGAIGGDGDGDGDELSSSDVKNEKPPL